MQYLTDYHTHSLFSPDSTARLEDIAAAALAAGASELCITDHCDLQAEPGFEIRLPEWEKILPEYRRVRDLFHGRLRVLLGLELGGALADPEQAQAMLSSAPLDFVIGSVHNLSPRAGNRDFYFLDYRTKADAHEALDDYFDSLLALACSPYYDALGHILYPLRYINGRAGHHITLEGYAEQLERILCLVIKTGRAIEVNTHCGREIEGWRPILTRYRALGGTYVTTGSDAHTPQDVARGLSQATSLLKETGFDHLTVYRNRRPEQIAL